MTSRPTTQTSTPPERPKSVQVKFGGVTIDVDLTNGAVTVDGASYVHAEMNEEGVHVVEPHPDTNRMVGRLFDILDPFSAGLNIGRPPFHFGVDFETEYDPFSSLKDIPREQNETRYHEKDQRPRRGM